MTVFPTDSYGHYEIERMLGRGAMGIVYAARDRRIGRRVALKTIELAPNQFSDETAADQFFKRLQREAEVCGSLLHPNIVTLYEAGYDDSGRISYLAMELVEGDTLLSLMKQARPARLPVDKTLRVAADVLRGLVHAHAKSIIHRDIKPANILLGADGTAKLADFGIARPQDSDMTGADTLLGTPNYMPPEQVLGERLTTQADMFSLGVLLYEMLSGTKPFAGSELATLLHNIVRGEVANIADINPELPRPLGDFVARLMSKASEGRPTAAEALEEITALQKSGAAGGSENVVPAPLAISGEAPRDEPQAAAKTFIEPAKPAVVIGKSAKKAHVHHTSVARTPRIRRPVYGVIIAGVVILLLITAVGRTKAWLDGSPTITIPQWQQREFAEKRQDIDSAKAAYEAGHYEESVKQYDAYLQRYPNSVRAREGRKHAAAALARQRQPDRKKSGRSSRKQDEDISPSELLHRLKKVFRH